MMRPEIAEKRLRLALLAIILALFAPVLAAPLFHGAFPSGGVAFPVISVDIHCPEYNVCRRAKICILDISRGSSISSLHPLWQRGCWHVDRLKTGVQMPLGTGCKRVVLPQIERRAFRL